MNTVKSRDSLLDLLIASRPAMAEKDMIYPRRRIEPVQCESSLVLIGMNQEL